ncbi:transporter substrate-binding domain-containing protein [Vibrio hannami]|uniref:substrate-binding periplasmic protein n=1 Tax=Vibrio hannami TaxID=2717094 RepID=UPI00240EF0A4|nr:transporter substrate-binding domain-containing protein [Vibrio hannami]MDG3087929.1 transporter substrate-binding domain-containing protein [Vibrio hannami]
MAKLAILLLLFSNIAFASVKIFVYDYPPLVEVSGNQPKSGLSYELVERLFNKANVPHYYTQQPLRRALYRTQNEVDSCTFPVERNQNREASYRWIGPVAINRFAFFSSPERKISLFTLEDAKQYQVSGFAGTGIVDYLLENDFDVFETKKVEHGLQMLIHDRVELWVSDTHTASTLANKYRIKQLEPDLTFFTAINYMACNSNMSDERFDELSATLGVMYQSGEAQNILKIHLIEQ